MTPEERERARVEETGEWPDDTEGPYHRHFANNAIHRDDELECDQPGTPRRVYVFDPDQLSRHERFIAMRARGESADEIAQLKGELNRARMANTSLVEERNSWARKLADTRDEADAMTSQHAVMRDKAIEVEHERNKLEIEVDGLRKGVVQQTKRAQAAEAALDHALNEIAGLKRERQHDSD